MQNLKYGHRLSIWLPILDTFIACGHDVDADINH